MSSPPEYRSPTQFLSLRHRPPRQESRPGPTATHYHVQRRFHPGETSPIKVLDSPSTKKPAHRQITLVTSCHIKGNLPPRQLYSTKPQSTGCVKVTCTPQRRVSLRVGKYYREQMICLYDACSVCYSVIVDSDVSRLEVCQCAREQA